MESKDYDLIFFEKSCIISIGYPNGKKVEYMKKFEGMLLCSDWDGTLFRKEVINKEDRAAISYFEENGGMFTVCSGRYRDFLSQYAHLIRPNTYLITLNGAIIVHPDTKKVLYEGFLDTDVIPVLRNILHMGIPYSTVLLYRRGASECETYDAQDFQKIENELENDRFYKILLRTDTPEHGESGARMAQAYLGGKFEASRSWETSLEIMKAENNKGHAILRLKEAVGAHTVIAVGDYENDISMLRTADISYAVGGAPDYVKRFADYVTVPFSECPMAHIISELENRIGEIKA